MDVPSTFWILVALLTILSVAQLQFGVVCRDPSLVLLASMFLMYFGYGGSNFTVLVNDYFGMFTVLPSAMIRAGALALLAVSMVWVGYLIPQDGRPRRTSGLDLVPGYDALMVISIIGLGATLLVMMMKGGISTVWSRGTRAAAGGGLSFGATLRAISDLSVLFPLFVYYKPSSASKRQQTLAIGFIGIYGLLAAISGTSSRHIMNLMPFGMIWLARHRPSAWRMIVFIISGLTSLTILRYLRHMGKLPADQRDWIGNVWGFIDGSNSLSLPHSIGEFYIFALVVQMVDDYGLQWGRSYLVALIAFVPGIFLPGKADFLRANRNDLIIPSRLGFAGHSWPSGFYGEAYLNFALPGLIVVSILIGWLTRRSGLWLRSEHRIVGLPAWLYGCYLATGVASTVRMEMSGITTAFIHILVLWAIFLPLWFATNHLWATRQPFGRAGVRRYVVVRPKT